MCDPKNCELLKLKEDFGLVPEESLTEDDILNQNLRDFDWINRQFELDKTLVLKRTSRIENAVLGSLYFRGVFLCYTLERYDKMIPKGRFPLKLTFSPKFRRFTPEVVVKDRKGIRIHCGNSLADTTGCILVGLQASKAILKYSTLAYDLLHYNIRFSDVNTLLVINDF